MFFRKKLPPVAWIITFLGNPGHRFENTRHNAGFMTADIIAAQLDVKINNAKYNALTAVTEFGGEKVLLIKPQTYMNLSGNSVKQALSAYKLPLNRVIVISDDISLPIGKLRIRSSGSAGGHNGLKDIIYKCGGDGFPRVRIGVGAPPDEESDVKDWVLSELSEADKTIISQAAYKAAAAAETIIMQGIERAMSKYN